MSEVNKTPKSESFGLMKHWLITKFQSSDDGNQQEIKHGNELPKIVISKGSNKSINKLVSPVTSPIFKRPSPLVKTWSDCRESSPLSAPHFSSKSFWFSSTSCTAPLKVQSRGNFHTGPPHQADTNSSSLPSTPIQPDFIPARPPAFETCSPPFKSPIFRFSQKNKIPITGGLAPSTSAAWSRSDLDCESLCGACGQQKYYGSRDLVGFMSTPSSAEDVGIHSAVSSPKLPHRKLELRRTSSCCVPEKKIFQKSATITKASSNVDVQKRSSSKRVRVNRTGSKEVHRSTISLTRSWSINLDRFRIVRNDSLHSKDITDRKMSLNDTELRRQKEERRRSSILRLLCHDNTNSEKGEDKCDSISISESYSEEEVSYYSPKVTRASTSKFVNGDPFEDFKSTLESDSFKIPSPYGQLKLMFQFFNAKSELQVTLLKGSNVAQGQTGTLGVYTKLCLMPGKLQTKTGYDKHNTKNPVFYEPFIFKMSLDELLQKQLRIRLYNKPGIFSTSEPIGECSVALYNFDLTAVTVIWQNLNKCKKQKDELDQFDFGPLERHQRRRRKLQFFLCGIGKKYEVNTEEPE